MLAKPQGFPRKLGGCAGLDPRLRSAVSAGVGDGERGLRRGLRAPGVGVRPKWVLEYSPSNKRIRYFVSITYVRTGLWTAHKFCGGGGFLTSFGLLFAKKKFKTPPEGDIPLNTEIPISVDNTLRPRDRNLVLWFCALRPWLTSSGGVTVHETQFIARPDGFFQNSAVDRCAVRRLTFCRQVYSAAKSIFTTHATLSLVRVLITTCA